jgi:hypothetical protein
LQDSTSVEEISSWSSLHRADRNDAPHQLKTNFPPTIEGALGKYSCPIVCTTIGRIELRLLGNAKRLLI